MVRGIALLLADNIPFLIEISAAHIVQMLMGIDSSYSSTVGRSAYIMLTMNLIVERPFPCWRVDGFNNFFHIILMYSLKYAINGSV